VEEAILQPGNRICVGPRMLGDAGLDWSMPKFDHRDVVFLAELLCGGGDVVSRTTAECFCPLKSKQFVLRISRLDDSIRQQGKTATAIEFKARF